MNEPQPESAEAPGALRADPLPEPVSHPSGTGAVPAPGANVGRPVLRDAAGRRIYSDEEIAHALAHLENNGGNVLATSEALGIPDNTLWQWKNGQRRHVAASPQMRERIRQQLAERARGVADRMLTRLETADLETVGVRDAAIVFGIVTEKSLLLDGEATQITETRTPETESKAARIRDRYAKRRKLVQVDGTPVALNPAPGPKGGEQEQAEGSGEKPAGT